VAEPLARLHARVVQGSRVLSWAAVCALLLVCAAVLVDVSLRWMFNAPLHGLEDLTGLVITVAIAACMPAGMALRNHITVRALGHLLGPRGHALLEVFGQCVTLSFIALAAWQLLIYTGDVAKRTSPVLELPIAPVWTVTAGFVVLAAVVQAMVVAIQAIGAWRGESPAAHGPSAEH
jgi:TRAP-type C4-dicarboxylate transport system permease small subunit